MVFTFASVLVLKITIPPLPFEMYPNLPVSSITIPWHPLSPSTEPICLPVWQSAVLVRSDHGKPLAPRSIAPPRKDGGTFDPRQLSGLCFEGLRAHSWSQTNIDIGPQGLILEDQATSSLNRLKSSLVTDVYCRRHSDDLTENSDKRADALIANFKSSLRHRPSSHQ